MIFRNEAISTHVGKIEKTQTKAKTKTKTKPKTTTKTKTYTDKNLNHDSIFATSLCVTAENELSEVDMLVIY